jgi:hypothetical protein
MREPQPLFGIDVPDEVYDDWLNHMDDNDDDDDEDDDE